MNEELRSAEHKRVVGLLKLCAKNKDLPAGARVHDDIVKQGLLLNNLFVASALVTMYVKCNALAKAKEVLEGLPARNVVTWNSLIAGYVREEGLCEEALNCFVWMQREGHIPDPVTFACILKACGSIHRLETGKDIHAEIARQGLLQDVVIGSALVGMYTKCGALSTAREVFEHLPVRDVVTWSTLIAGYAQDPDHFEEAMSCFRQMHCEGHLSDAVTFACVLKACGSMQELLRGRQIHMQVIARQGSLREDIVLGVSLVDMYVKCRECAAAREVLEGYLVRNVTTWNALITGYVHEPTQCKEALNCYEQMQREGHSPDAVTYVGILKACGSIKALGKGKTIHDEILKKKTLIENVVIGSALVDMYVKCGAFATAREVLGSLVVRDAATWNPLIAGYSEAQELAEEGFCCFERMQCEGTLPNAVTFACILKVCGSRGALNIGKRIHAEIARTWLLRESMVLGSAVVEMYARCGALARAKEVLENLPVQDVLSWNTLVAGYAQHGHSEEVLICFEHMQHDGYSPDAVTFTNVLKSCSRSGLVDQGLMYFAKMSKLYGIEPSEEHHLCMLDLFGRAGHFEKAIEIMKKMPSCDSCSVWSTLMGACQKWGNVKLGRRAFDNGLCLDKENLAAYISMSNMYAAVHMEET